MPNVYRGRMATDAPGTTRYRVFTGDEATFRPNYVSRKVTEFTDGIANTILVVIAGEAVPWTKPAELLFVEGTGPKLGNQPDRFMAVFADGHVQVFKHKTLDEKTLRALITPAGGEVVKIPED